MVPVLVEILIHLFVCGRVVPVLGATQTPNAAGLLVAPDREAADDRANLLAVQSMVDQQNRRGVSLVISADGLGKVELASGQGWVYCSFVQLREVFNTSLFPASSNAIRFAVQRKNNTLPHV